MVYKEHNYSILTINVFKKWSAYKNDVIQQHNKKVSNKS